MSSQPKTERNGSCPCCSGKKYKQCCIDLKPPKNGTLRHAYSFGTSTELMNRILFQPLEIRDKIYKGKDKDDFDKRYDPIFQNLYEAMLAHQKSISLINEHRRRIQSGEGCSYNKENGTLTIDESIDNDLNMAVKDLFIRGQIAIDATIDLIAFMGYKVSFVFKNDEDFQKKSKKFLEVNNSLPFHQFIKGMKAYREGWYEQFNKIRNQIEHQGYKIPQIQYGLNDDNRITPIFFTMGNQTANEALDVCWDNLFRMCEEMVITFLSIKLPKPFVIVEVPEEERDANNPLRFQLGINMNNN